MNGQVTHKSDRMTDAHMSVVAAGIAVVLLPFLPLILAAYAWLKLTGEKPNPAESDPGSGVVRAE